MDQGSQRRHAARELLALAMPGALMLLLDNLYRSNDLYWVKEIGRQAQSAVSVASMVSILTFALYGGLAVANMSWNLIRIPLAHWLALSEGYGLLGIWWAVNLSTYGKALTGMLLLRPGRWQGTGL